jgi:hypothetical protein
MRVCKRREEIRLVAALLPVSGRRAPVKHVDEGMHGPACRDSGGTIGAPGPWKEPANVIRQNK